MTDDSGRGSDGRSDVEAHVVHPPVVERSRSRRRRGAPVTHEPGGGSEARPDVEASLLDPPVVERPGASRCRRIAEWVLVVGGAVLLAVVIRAFVLQVFWIPSLSMAPTLREDDRVVVDELSYRFRDVHRGEVVVFDRPPSEPPGEVDHLIKRVVAIGGETVEAHGGRVYVDGEPLDEPYLPAGTVTARFGPIRVPEGSLWVMGDNRGNSQDSRWFGPVDEDSVVGRAVLRIWPLGAVAGV